MSEMDRTTLAARLRLLADGVELIVGPSTADEMRQAADALDALAWQPMETAPKDRDIIVLTDSIVGLPSIVCQCRWHPDAGFCVDELRQPQWWMEMPPAPATDTREREG